ncbi:MAG: hypothetical protein RR379_06635 [Clostridia bacterium]
MTRYTAEQKELALKRMEEIGVPKTFKEMGISVQTLYQWKSAQAKDAQPKAAQPKAAKKPVSKGAKKAVKSKKPVAKEEDAMAVVEAAAVVEAEPIAVEPVAVEPVAVETEDACIQEARLLLNDDNYLSDKVAQLENEVAKLGEQNLKLKKALAALIG